MGVEKMQVDELLDLIHNHYLDRMVKLRLENKELQTQLRYYKELAGCRLDADLINENIRLRKQIEKSEEKCRYCSEHKPPF